MSAAASAAAVKAQRAGIGVRFRRAGGYDKCGTPQTLCRGGGRCEICSDNQRRRLFFINGYRVCADHVEQAREMERIEDPDDD